MIAQVVVWLNMALAFGAVVACWVAAWRGTVTSRAHFAGVGALAALYVCGYVWLILNPHEAVGWSEFFRGVSLAAWAAVWIAPAVRSVRTHSDMMTKIDELEQSVKERLS